MQRRKAPIEGACQRSERVGPIVSVARVKPRLAFANGGQTAIAIEFGFGDPIVPVRCSLKKGGKLHFLETGTASGWSNVGCWVHSGS